MKKQRLKTLKNYNLLKRQKIEDFERLLDLAIEICGFEMGHLVFINGNKALVKCKRNTHVSSFNLEGSLCNATLKSSQGSLLISDLSSQDLSDKDAFIEHHPEIRCYVGQSIVDAHGTILGALCLYDTAPKSLTASQVDSLKKLSREIMDKIESYSRQIQLDEFKQNISDGKYRFQTYLNNTGDLVFLLDEKLRLVELYGLPKDLILKDHNIVGKKIDHLDLDEEVINELQSITQDGSSSNLCKSLEFSKGIDTTERWFNINMNKILREDSEIEILCVIRDITHQKITNEKLINSKIEAIEASQAKSDFVANISHEMRTPLNGIIGFSDLLMKTELNDVQRQYMKTVFQSANTLLELINNILDFSKVESGKLGLKAEKTELTLFLNEVIDLTKYQANVKGLKLILEVEDNIPTYIWIDSVRLKQVLMNLINNSIKFTDHGFVKLSVKLISQTHKVSVIRFFVEDTGKGIAKKNQKKIFNAFVQEDISITKTYGGTGLGLTISDQILDLMKSKLKLTSEIGKGTAFYFDISVKSKPDNQPKHFNKTRYADECFTFEPKLDQDTRTSQKAGKKNFLIVEDNLINMELIKSYISNIHPHANIYEAEDGQEALEIFNTQPIDFIFSDIQMPKMNGYELTKAIREKHTGKDIPIIAITAGTIIGTKEKCLEAGMTDYISKPILQDAIKSVILEHLNLKDLS